MREDSEGYAKLFTALNRFGADALTPGQVDALVRTSVRHRIPCRHPILASLCTASSALPCPVRGLPCQARASVDLAC